MAADAKSDSRDLRPMFRPDALGRRGEALWDALADEIQQDAARLILLAEASRLADTLDKLDELISGDADAWARITQEGSDGELVVRLDGVLSERRSVIGVLRLTIRQLGGGDAADAGGGLLDALALARAERLAGTSIP